MEENCVCLQFKLGLALAALLLVSRLREHLLNLFILLQHVGINSYAPFSRCDDLNPLIDTMVGKKKRGHPDVEDLLARPWCYYCV